MNLRIHRDPDSAPAPLGRRILARIHGWHLDHELAAGADPLADPILTERAAKLAAPANRHQLADRLRALVEGAERAAAVERRGPGGAHVRSPRARPTCSSWRARLDSTTVRSACVVSRLQSVLARQTASSPVWAPGDPGAIADAVSATARRDRGLSMDVLMVALALVAFAVLYLLIEGLDRV